MLQAPPAPYTQAVRDAAAAASGRWIMEEFAPDVVAMLKEAPDAADLALLLGLVMQGAADVAQQRFQELESLEQRQGGS